MPHNYDIIPTTHLWFEDDEPTTGDLYAYDRALANPHVAVDGLWRIDIGHGPDGRPVPFLAYVIREDET